MELTIAERLLLLTVLPAQGDLLTIRIVRQLREDLSFTEQEIAEHDITTHEGGRITWESETLKTVEIGAKGREIIVAVLAKLDADGKVEERFLSLFDKFGVGAA